MEERLNKIIKENEAKIEAKEAEFNMKEEELESIRSAHKQIGEDMAALKSDNKKVLNQKQFELIKKENEI